MQNKQMERHFKGPIPLSAMRTHWIIVGADLLKYLHRRLKEIHPSVTLALAGGCVRDQLNGLEPKDIDLVVIGAIPCDHEAGVIGTEGELYDLLEDYGYAQVKHFNRDMADSYAERFPGDEDRFDAIVKYKPHDIDACGDYPLDVLFYNERYTTVADIAESHDHSINQFAAWVDDAGELQWKYFGDVGGWGFCMQIRNGITDERRVRVGEICTAIGWAYAGDL